MGTVQSMFGGGNSLDTTNAVCSFNGTIEHIGRVEVAVFKNRIVYQESKGCGGCAVPSERPTQERIEFRNISAMQRYIPCVGPMGPRGINLFVRSAHSDEMLTIKGPTEEHFNQILDAWKKSSWPNQRSNSDGSDRQNCRPTRR